MRPLRLTLQAFGSYAGSLTVDFSRLGRHGIFAITGPTGAGKSTIFDALVYALYDDLPGFREDGNVRSQFADAETETVVVLDFEVHGQVWRIERAPTQRLRGRRRGGPPVERKSRVVLARVDDHGETLGGSSVTRKPAAKALVEELVGLTKEQFEQVVLIPQGKFEEVLKADTATRAPLVRRLFPVDAFGRVTEALKAIASGREADFHDARRAADALVDRLRAALGGLLDQVPAQVRQQVAARGIGEGSCVAEGFRAPRDFDVGSLGRYLDEVRALRVAVDAAADTAARAHREARDACAAAAQAAERHDRWREDCRLAEGFADEETADGAERAALDAARRLVDLRSVCEAWAEASARLAALAPDLAAARRGVDDAWTPPYAPASLPDAAGAPAVQLLAAGVRAEAASLREAAASFDELAGTTAALDVREAELDRRSRELDERRGALARAAADLEGLASAQAGAARAAASGAPARAALDLLERELAVARRRAELDEDVRAAGARVHEAAEKAAAERGRAAALRGGWRDGLAGRLAGLLVDGEPCPTCGAREHPAPAVLLEDAPDEAEVAAAERARDEAEAAWREAERGAAAVHGELAALPPSRAHAVVDEARRAVAAELAAAQEAAALADRLEAEAAARDAALAGARAGLEEAALVLERDAGALAAERALHERACGAFAERHGAFVSPGPAADAHAVLAERLEALAAVLEAWDDARATEERCTGLLAPVALELGVGGPAGLAPLALAPAEIDARAAALEERRVRRAEVRRRIDAYAAEHGPTARPELGPFEAALADAERRERDLVGRQAVVARLAGELAAGPDLLVAAEKEVQTTRRALEEARSLAALCAGTSSGAGAASSRARGAPARLSLENWVLADYLRRVLVQANVRLATMSGGRYALELHEGVTDGRKPWGLDIAAFDAHTGQVRPATTLSGGETFMAALALALGLADVVSGGSNRRIGALFVDEGFGSLDPEALESVLEVLRSLEDGGRTVGVISHVEELNQALPVGISVQPSAEGSVATLHYPDEDGGEPALAS